MQRAALIVVGVLFSFVGTAKAASIAVIDSGVDYKHVTLAPQMWKNPQTSTKDKDGKVYKDDTRGWNFAENNNQIIDYKYLGTFSDDCSKIFHVQAKILQDQATAEEKSWYDGKKADATFVKELSKFGNFVHGTHVSGLSSANAPKSALIGLKLIATAPPGEREIEAFRSEHGTQFREASDPLVKLYLGMVAQQQAKLLVTVGKYTDAVKAEVANGSFGTSVKAVTPIIKQLVQQLTGKEPSEEDARDYAVYLVGQIASASKEFVTTAPGTLFVFAAGNDGTDNDALPTSPANLKADNVITVAATVGVTKMATFTNYGANMVEVAAPGVALVSTIPGDKTLPMSGTSMAAPYVTNIAGLVKDENAQLAPKDIKEILMGTVDAKPWLAGKVKTGGIVNKDRAVMAARLSLTHTVSEAIAMAKAKVDDMAPTAIDFRRSADRDLIVVPLPSTLQ